MILIQAASKAHVSHYLHLVSPYELSPQVVQDHINTIQEAVVKAKTEKKAIIVEFDSVDHIFITYPSGVLYLYASMGSFDIEEP